MDQGAFIPIDQRFAIADGRELGGVANGVVLSLDLVGSTLLIDTLVKAVGPRRAVGTFGAFLSRLFGLVIQRVHSHRGSVVSFGGDAVTCWFESPGELAALQCASEIRDMFATTHVLHLPDSSASPVGLKLALCAGSALRCVVGRPEIQRMDVLAGRIMGRVAAAGHLANLGRIVVDEQLRRLSPIRVNATGSVDGGSFGNFLEFGELLVPVIPRPWPGVPPAIASAASSWIHPHVQQRLASMGSFLFDEMRSPAILFVGFGGVDYDNDPEAGTKLDRFVCWVQDVLGQHEALLLQLLMDEKGSHFYASFGAPRANEDDSGRALAAACQLLNPPSDLSFISGLRAGVSRGPVYAGAYGGNERCTYGVLGRDVHIAARLMEAADPGEVMLTAVVAKDADQTFEFEDRGELVLRGIETTTRAFRVKSRKLARTVPAPKAGYLHGLVGRRQEIAALTRRLDGLDRGDGGGVLLVGDAGIGKSRLVAETWGQAQARGFMTLAGFGEPAGMATPYHIWRPIFDALFGFAKGDVAAQRAGAVLAERGFQANLAPLLNVALPLGLPENDHTSGMSPEVRGSQTRSLLTGLLRQEVAAAGCPVMLVMEDVHWADRASWALLDLVLRELPSLLVLVTTRPPEANAALECLRMLEVPGSERIDLCRLDADATELLACGVLGVEAMGAELRFAVNARSEGNPFVVQEILRDLLESHRIRVKDGIVQSTSTEEMASIALTPRSIQDIITSRFDRLAPGLQALLKVASVVGRAFSASALKDILGPHVSADEMSRDLTDLTTLAILVARPAEGADHFAFSHAITQEVVYGILLESQRESLHRAVAQWWEMHYADDLSSHLGVLAHHWERAGDVVRAVEYLDGAAESALKNFSNDEAAILFDRVRHLTDHHALPIADARQAHWAMGAGDAMAKLFRNDLAEARVRRGLELLEYKFPRKSVQVVLRMLKEAVKQLGRRLLPMVFRPNPPVDRERTMEVARGLEKLIEPFVITGRTAEAYCAVFTVMNLAEDCGPSPELVRSFANMGLGLGLEGMHGAARAYIKLAGDVLAAAEDAPTRVYVGLMAGVYHTGIGDWKQAGSLLQMALELAESLGDARRATDVLTALVPSLIMQDRMQEAVALSDRLVVLGRSSVYSRNLCEALYIRAAVHMATGKHSGAKTDMDEFDRTRRSDPSLGEATLDAMHFALRAELALAAGQSDEAEFLVRDGLAAAEQKRFLFVSSYWSYAALGDVAVRLLGANEGCSPARRSQLLILVRRALGVMAWFTHGVPVARPALLRIEAQYALLSGRKKKAAARLRLSAEAARGLGMPMEERRAQAEASGAGPASWAAGQESAGGEA